MLNKPEALKEIFEKKKKIVYKFAGFLLELKMSCVVDFWFFKRHQRSQCFMLL